MIRPISSTDDPILSSLHTLSDLLAWTSSQVPPLILSAIVSQDEYTLDVVVPYHDGLYLVFDTT